MVTNVTSLTGNGLKDWLIQRISALFLMGYIIFLFGFVLLHPGLDYSRWHELFHSRLVQATSVLALVSMLLHAWVGIWTVTTDYIKCTVIRLSVQMLVALCLLAEVIWGCMIVWGQ
jgi:succinate dehydrogenase / fumarate reductase, membrane anchor subunit